MKQQLSKAHYALCVKNEGYAASLEREKIYRIVPDDNAAGRGCIRVIDESGEDYLYPKDYFLMKFDGEEDFRNWLVENIEKALKKLDQNYTVLESKNVADIVICKEESSKCKSVPVTVFIEVKYFKKSSNRIGVGNSIGRGFQPEILDKNPKSMQEHMRWIIANPETGQVVFENNEKIRKFVSGKQQHNNISMRIFKDREIKILTTSDILNQAVDWLESL